MHPYIVTILLNVNNVCNIKYRKIEKKPFIFTQTTHWTFFHSLIFLTYFPPVLHVSRLFYTISIKKHHTYKFFMFLTLMKFFHYKNVHLQVRRCYFLFALHLSCVTQKIIICLWAGYPFWGCEGVLLS